MVAAVGALEADVEVLAELVLLGGGVWVDLEGESLLHGSSVC